MTGTKQCVMLPCFSTKFWKMSRAGLQAGNNVQCACCTNMQRGSCVRACALWWPLPRVGPTPRPGVSALRPTPSARMEHQLAHSESGPYRPHECCVPEHQPPPATVQRMLNGGPAHQPASRRRCPNSVCMCYRSMAGVQMHEVYMACGARGANMPNEYHVCVSKGQGEASDDCYHGTCDAWLNVCRMSLKSQGQ